MRKVKLFYKIAKQYFFYKTGKPTPFICVYNVTHKCNLSCPYCAIASDCLKDKKMNNLLLNSGKKEVGTSLSKEIIEKIASTGVSVLTFSGGEPLLREDIFELAAMAKKKMLVSLYTNGLLINENNLRKLDVFDTIMVSLPEISSKNFRTKKEINRLNKSFKLLRGADANVGVSFVITKNNYFLIEDVFNYSRDVADFIFFNPVHYAPDFFPSKEEAIVIQKKILKLKKENPRFVSNSLNFIEKFEDYFARKQVSNKCLAYDFYLSVLPDGNLQGCCEPIVAGNILEYNINSLINEGKKEKKKITERCQFKQMMGGCGQPSYLFNQNIKDSLISGFNLFCKLFSNR